MTAVATPTLAPITLPPLSRAVLLDGKRAYQRDWPTYQPSREELDAHVAAGGNVGFKTGEVIGDDESVWVLDFDVKAGGLDALDALEARYGRLDGFRRVRTGSGGLHIYLNGAVRGTRSRKLAVLDTGLEVELKANGSQVVWRGIHPATGAAYEIESQSGHGDCPAWLIELVERRPRPTYVGHIETGLPRGCGIHSIAPAVYVPALTGAHIDARSKALCPLHDDHEPTLHVYPARWYCSACQVGGRIRQLAGIVLGLGHQEGTRWTLSDSERALVDEHLEQLFPAVT
jgi:hypothetical protein